MSDFEFKIIQLFVNNFYLDISSMHELVELLIYDKNLNNYLNIVTFEKSKSNNLAIFLINHKKLLFDYDNINYFFNNWYRNLGLPLDANEMRRFYNLYVIKIILHEIKHVFQVKESEIRKNDSIGIILKEGIELGRRSPFNLTYNERLLYKYMHDYIPTEKDAEISCIFELINLNNKRNFLTTNELSVLYYELINHLLKGYSLKKNMCSTELYYFFRGKAKEFYNILFNEDYNNITKLSWGIPVNNEIINDIKLIKKSKEYNRLLEILS